MKMQNYCSSSIYTASGNLHLNLIIFCFVIDLVECLIIILDNSDRRIETGRGRSSLWLLLSVFRLNIYLIKFCFFMCGGKERFCINLKSIKTIFCNHYQWGSTWQQDLVVFLSVIPIYAGAPKKYLFSTIQDCNFGGIAVLNMYWPTWRIISEPTLFLKTAMVSD